MNLNWPLRGVIVLLSSVCDDAGIGLDFGGSQVGVVCWVLGAVVDLCLEMDRLVESELAASRSNCFAQLCL